MQKHHSYIGIEPFTVLIDESSELETLIEEARKLNGLPFEQRLDSTKKLALGAMVNSYEEWQSNPNLERREYFREIVMKKHPLSYALRQKAGCCRYQGALFFVLGFEADLGDIHFIQQAPVNPDSGASGMKSVFNDIVHNGKIHHVSIFKESLKDSSLDYSRTNPRVFESAIGFPWSIGNPSPSKDPFNYVHYSYHRTDRGLVILSEEGQHILKYQE